MLDDRPLLDGFRKGLKQSLHAVYVFYLDDVVALARIGFVAGKAHVVGLKDRSEQLDRAHDVFVKAFKPKARQSYDGLRPYRPFLMRIGKNAIIDKLRKEKVDLPLQEIHAPIVSKDVEEELHFSRLRQITEDWLLKQSQEVRAFVHWRFEMGLGQAKVATEMKCSRRRVRTIENQVQEALAQHLRALGHLEKNQKKKRPDSDRVA